MSTPRNLQIPSGVRRITVETARGPFAALEALPATGVCERQPALLVPGYTGSKEDFLPVLGPLAAAGRRVLAADMRGQYETPGSDDPGGYELAALAADLAVIADSLGRCEGAPGTAGPGPGGPVHLLGHSFGGLVARDLALAWPTGIGSLTLMSSGPGALSGPRADVLSQVLAELDGKPPRELGAEVKRIWDTHLEPQAVADGVPPDVIGFLRTRMLSSSGAGLKFMAQQLLVCPDRTAALAKLADIQVLVLYGEDDDAWAPVIQEEMARQLRAQRVCIPGAAHSPAVEAPETTASVLTSFWNGVECDRRRGADRAASG